MRWKLLLLGGVSVLTWCSAAEATFVSGSTGADGAFSPTSNTVLQLPPDGKFNYTTVNIPSGVTVTYTKNAANTPVYILATGDVTIAGTISVNGASTTSSTNTSPGTGGPGGYDGGYGGASSAVGGKGLGPGGGNGGPASGNSEGGGGGFGSAGGTYGSGGTGGPAYGNAKLSPIIGGSGGGGNAGSTNAGSGGGGGGGAILIAASGTITVSGSATANGGDGYSYAGGGSGGGIRLIANIIYGNGTISAKGGDLSVVTKGGNGRIRIEAYTISRTAGTDPPYSYGLPGTVFVSNMPSLNITSIAGTNVPASPTGSYSQPDMMLPSTTTNPATVNVSASNIPVGTSVKVRAIPQYGNENTATSTLSGTDASSTASANVTLSTTYSNVVTAEATFTIVGMYYDGEEIDKVLVTAMMGGSSETTYITKSGKEIKGEILAALVK